MNVRMSNRLALSSFFFLPSLAPLDHNDPSATPHLSICLLVLFIWLISVLQQYNVSFAHIPLLSVFSPSLPELFFRTSLHLVSSLRLPSIA